MSLPKRLKFFIFEIKENRRIKPKRKEIGCYCLLFLK